MASGESKGSRRYDKENLLWQSGLTLLVPAMTDGMPDAAKMKPICFDTCQHVYRIMGDAVAKAFSCGRTLGVAS